METIETVQRFLEHMAWYATPVPASAISFLAAGEYNENWRIRHEGRDEVLRVNHGSQLRFADQIGYEYAVLRAVHPSGVTPRALRVKSRPRHLSGGALLMEYLPGRPLDYRTDLEAAAHTFAAVHSVVVPRGCPLLRQPDPVADIAADGLRLIHRFPDHPRTDVRDALLRYHERVVRLGEDTRALFEGERQVIANTEVNSGNFLVHDGVARLVDWEKAVVTPRYQDLGHFLAPTTTLWKTDTVLDEADRRRFLAAYRDALTRLAGRETVADCHFDTTDTAEGVTHEAAFHTTAPDAPGGQPHGDMAPDVPDLDALAVRTDVLVRAVLLRGLAWCYMAWQEYATDRRPLAHPDTLRTIERYLAEVSWFLR
ncbi:phosphotransferase [Nitratidesulfovibrio vulgaris]|uniref:Aminoglycoside phosphotransferase domain-containing protein n=1 Tax=Nitratidesulfovibrio vulgaris (strain ATCC 29579 / DSM 644 / CCUG 34227 / NCIMB 8303 / VKM B-1760 / Hildenborough) TaxID=882 RepID=Q72FC2_NITV2|nr:phosphotransferase [Nitratidesulfovibrio vulgaris]AAS94775.1 hypothetical protein DVU_0292 [Nitratidesulfovibrio vulgaris str. Hildenborough]ADP85434.1 aminoglycoside phosphotransferase [Nitratidesulfovibrio vulgaris RCH1]